MPLALKGRPQGNQPFWVPYDPRVRAESDAPVETHEGDFGSPRNLHRLATLNGFGGNQVLEQWRLQEFGHDFSNPEWVYLDAGFVCFCQWPKSMHQCGGWFCQTSGTAIGSFSHKMDKKRSDMPFIFPTGETKPALQAIVFGLLKRALREPE